jgi:hypothetical protein
MPIPRIVGQWNKAGLNRVTKHIAPWNGRYCGFSASRTSCPSRPHLPPHQPLASPDSLIAGLRRDASVTLGLRR